MATKPKKLTWIERINAKVQRRVPELAHTENQQLLQDLIDDAFTQIILHSNANEYNMAWDNILVNCVVTLYNYLGMEGSISRWASGIRDEYSSSNILSSILSNNIPPYIRPSGYKYKSTRFEQPID